MVKSLEKNGYEKIQHVVLCFFKTNDTFSMFSRIS